MNIQKIIIRAALAMLPLWAAQRASATPDYPNKPIRIVVAYAPGGQEAMVALALVLDADPIFVATHHLGRYFLINLSLPFIVAWMRRSEAKGGE